MTGATGASTGQRVGRLEVGDAFPEVTAPLVGGGEIVLPDAVRDGWAALLFYRGHWCPYCRGQLADFQRELHRFDDASVRVVALSADPEEEARETVEAHGIDFPVGYGLDPGRVRLEHGAYIGDEGSFVQATGFVLRPGGTVELAVYSTGAVGRLIAADALGLIEYAREHP